MCRASLGDAGHRDRRGARAVDLAPGSWALGDRCGRLGLGRSGWLLARSGLRGFERRLGEQTPEVTREVALEAAQRALVGVALGALALEVLLRGAVAAGAGDRDRVKRPVELAVARVVEPVPPRLAGPSDAVAGL